MLATSAYAGLPETAITRHVASMYARLYNEIVKGSQTGHVT